MENKKFSGTFMPRTGVYLWSILALTLVIGLLEWRVAVPSAGLLAALVVHNYRSNYRRQRELTKYIENLTFNIDSATKDTLLNFPMPLVLVELDGTIIWYNSSFRTIFDGDHLLQKAISSFVEELHPEKMGESRINISSEITVNQRHYRVMGNLVKLEGQGDNGEFILLLYLLDNTDLVELKKRYQEEKVAVGIVIIDNYDELMQGLEDTQRSQILAEIEKKITQWMGFTGSILKSFERDKYLFVFQHKCLKELEDKKFEILDTIKEIDIGNKIPVTLSLGLGLNGKTLLESLSYANSSIDIALGRGGDHVVIKNGDTFSFYGGKTRELEKRTRVKARVIAHALRELIDQSPMVMIMGHENCDVDVLGAALGIYRMVRNREKEVYIILNNSNPTIDNLLGRIEKYSDYDGLFMGRTDALDRITSKTLLIVVDSHKPSFTECPDLLKYTDQVVVIDHHRRGADFIQNAVLTYQETYASSTCELVTEILQYVEDSIKLKPVEAEALYAGIVVDTKNFTFKTGVRTFEAASFLRKQGVDTVAVKQLFQNDLNTYLVISGIIRDAEIIEEHIAVSSCPVGTRSPQLIAAQAADQLLNLSGLTTAFVMGSAGNEVFISGRSLGDLNVQMILEKLGGGGHQTIAGAQLQGISLEEARNRLKGAIRDYIAESANKES